MKDKGTMMKDKCEMNGKKGLFLGNIVLCSTLIFLAESVQAFGQGSKPFQGVMVKIVDSEQKRKSKEQFISFKDLKAFSLDSVRAREKAEDPERVWIGVPIQDVLAFLDVDCHTIQKISISAPDGYMSVITGDMLKDIENGLFAYQIQGVNNFPKKYGYMRILLPNLHVMTWVNGPDKIVVQVGEKQIAKNRYVLYPSKHQILNHLIQYKSDNPKVMLKDVLSSYGFSKNNFYVLTQDSLYREYDFNKVIKHMFLRREDDMTWTIDGVNVPTGLRTRDIVFLSSQQAGLFLKNLTDDEWSVWARRVVPNHLGENLEATPVTVRYFLEGEEGTDCAGSSVTITKPEDLVDILKKILAGHSDLDTIEILSTMKENE